MFVGNKAHLENGLVSEQEEIHDVLLSIDVEVSGWDVLGDGRGPAVVGRFVRRGDRDVEGVNVEGGARCLDLDDFQ